MNNVEKKQLVEDKRLPLYLDDIFDDKTVDEAIDELVCLSNEMTGEIHKFKRVYDWTESENSCKFYLISYRFETDKEYERRLKNEAKAKEKKCQLKIKREESEKKEYERLRKKYGEE